MVDIDNIRREILEASNPEWIVLYGSMGRGEEEKYSDIDILSIYKEKEIPNCNILNNKIESTDEQVFCSTLKEVENGTLNTLYNDRLFSWLISTGDFIYGKNFKQRVQLPDIRNIDLFEDTCFCRGSLYSSLLALKENQEELSKTFFYKGLLYGLRAKVIKEEKEYITRYSKIREKSTSYDIFSKKQKRKIKKAHNTRKNPQNHNINHEDISIALNSLNIVRENIINEKQHKVVLSD